MAPRSLLALGALTVACGADPEASGGAEGGPCPAAAVAECLVDQQRCVTSGGAPRCEPCPLQQYADASGACVPIPGRRIEHTFEGHTTPANSEIKGQCRSWTLGNDEELWVNAVELRQNEASHHSNWTFVPESRFQGPDGLWPCRERNYDQLTAALAGGVLYAQSTQASKEVQRFPDGVAIRIPPRSRVISDVHLYNVTDQDVTGDMTLAIHVLPAEEVTVRLAPFHVSYDELAIPPRSTSRFSGPCALDAQFRAQGAPGFELDVYYLLPHTHALGSRMFVEVVGGPSDGVSLIDVRGFNGEARGRRWDEPLRIRGATGLAFGCEFENPRNAEVNWGFGDQEMCEALGFAASPVAFESRISEVREDGTEGTLQRFTGECQTIAFRWDR